MDREKEISPLPSVESRGRRTIMKKGASEFSIYRQPYENEKQGTERILFPSKSQAEKLTKDHGTTIRQPRRTGTKKGQERKHTQGN